MADGIICDASEVAALAAILATTAARTPTVVDTVVVSPAAEELKRDAQADAPVLTGKLRSSITVSSNGPGSKTVGTDVRYARFQEFGTSVMAPHPFLLSNGDRAGDRMSVRLVTVAAPFDV